MNPIQIGQVLLNQFRVDSFVASGGMGAVYLVWDLQRNAPLAMKVLHAELAEDPSVFKRFQREARALQKLTHPNIVPFYGLYHLDDIVFILERYIDGPSLKDVLRQKKGEALPYCSGSVIPESRQRGAGLCPFEQRGALRCQTR